MHDQDAPNTADQTSGEARNKTRRRSGGVFAASVIAALLIGGAFSTVRASAQDSGEVPENSSTETSPSEDDREVIGDAEFEAYDKQFEQCLAENGVDLDALFELEESDATDEELDAAWESADPGLIECESVFDGVVHESDLEFEACLSEQGVDLDQIDAAEQQAIESGASEEELERVWDALEPKFEQCELTVFGDDFEDCEVIHSEDDDNRENNDENDDEAGGDSES